jgi:choline dehydrogenase
VSAPPVIDPNYLSTEEDRLIAIESIKLTRKIVGASTFTKYDPFEYKPGAQIQSDSEILNEVGNIGTTIFHPVGTCKMGTANDPMAVVDANLKVFGIEGLRVVDASVMPTITSGNTAAPTMMIAEKIAEKILAEQA